MKTQAAAIALVAVLFAAPAFADHNRTDEQGRKQGHWTEFPEVESLLSAEGKYVDGKAHGDWVLRYANGHVQEGPFVNGKRHGDWVLRNANGNVGEGPMVADKMHGHWVLRDADGNVWEGPYVGGKQHGQWIVRKPDGTEVKINWRNGEIIE